MALIPDDPKQRNALIIGILAAAGFYFFWSYWYTPINTEVVDMTARLEQLDSENNRAQIIATRGGTELQERLAVYERHVGLLETLIPQSEEVSALLNEITTVSRQTGVQLSNLAPEADQVGAFYTKQSYALEVVGDYHDLGRFFATISSLPRIITPVNMELTPFQGNRAVLDMEQPLTATVQIQTYILPASSAPPPGELGSAGRELIMKCLKALVLLAATGILIPVVVEAQQPPPPDTMDLIFEREVFVYPTFERRNPFVTVLSGSEGGPRYEELQLIGVIYSSTPDLSVALFGPRGGPTAAGGGQAARRTFRARLGDQLGNVRILEIQRTLVVVEVEEFGLTERREMELQRPGQGGTS